MQSTLGLIIITAGLDLGGGDVQWLFAGQGGVREGGKQTNSPCLY
jgi:hypothetical protein